MNYFLTEQSCNIAQNIANEIDNLCDKIRLQIENLNNIINDPELNTWFLDTEIGREAYDTAKYNNDELNALSRSLENLVNIINNLVQQSRINNSR